MRIQMKITHIGIALQQVQQLLKVGSCYRAFTKGGCIAFTLFTCILVKDLQRKLQDLRTLAL